MGRNCDSWDGSAIQLERRLKWILKNIVQPGMLSLGNKEGSESSRLKLLWNTAPQWGNTVIALFTFCKYEQVSMLSIFCFVYFHISVIKCNKNCFAKTQVQRYSRLCPRKSL